MKENNIREQYDLIQMFNLTIKRVGEIRLITNSMIGKTATTKEDACRKEIAVQMFSLIDKDSQINIIRQMGHTLTEQYNLSNI